MVATRRHPDGSFPDSSSTPSAPVTSRMTPSSSTIPTKNSSHSTLNSDPRKGYVHRPRHSVILWLLISLPLVVWDFLYMYLRPHSMPGGSLHSPVWLPYALYGTVDYVYGWPGWKAGNGFGAAQSDLNAVETLMYGIYLWIVWTRAEGPGREDGTREGDRIPSGKNAAWFVGLTEEGRYKVVRGSGVALAVVVALAAAAMTVSKTVLYWMCEYHSGFANIAHNDPLRLLIYWIIPNGAWLVFPGYMVYVLGKEMVGVLEGMGDGSDGGNDGGGTATTKMKKKGMRAT